MSETDIKQQLDALTAKLAAMEASSKPPSSSVVYMKSDRKFPKFAGRPVKDSDPDVIEWITDMREYISSIPSKNHHVDFIMDHLTGSAKSEIRLRPPEQRKTGEEILSILEELYHIKDTVSQLQQKFYQREQHDDETLEAYSLALMKIADQITRRAGKEMPGKDKALIERFIDGLKDQHLRQELRKFSIDKGPIPFLEFRHLMLKWIEDNPPSTDKHVHKTTTSENSELLAIMQKQQELLEKQQEQIDNLTKLTSQHQTYREPYYGRSRSYKRYPRGSRGRGRGTGRSRGRSYPDRSELTCFNCGGKGHKAPECPSENYRDGSTKHQDKGSQSRRSKEDPNGRPPQC